MAEARQSNTYLHHQNRGGRWSISTEEKEKGEWKKGERETKVTGCAHEPSNDPNTAAIETRGMIKGKKKLYTFKD